MLEEVGSVTGNPHRGGLSTGRLEDWSIDRITQRSFYSPQTSYSKSLLLKKPL